MLTGRPSPIETMSSAVKMPCSSCRSGAKPAKRGSSLLSISTTVDVAVDVLGDEDGVDEADDPLLDDLLELLGDLAVEAVALEPDDGVFEWTQRHVDSLSRIARSNFGAEGHLALRVDARLCPPHDAAITPPPIHPG